MPPSGPRPEAIQTDPGSQPSVRVRASPTPNAKDRNVMRSQSARRQLASGWRGGEVATGGGPRAEASTGVVRRAVVDWDRCNKRAFDERGICGLVLLFGAWHTGLALI